MASMISSRLVRLIQNNSESIFQRWLRNVRTHPQTSAYHTFPEDKLRKQIMAVFSKGAMWIDRSVTKEDIARHFEGVGTETAEAGIPLGDLVYALILAKRHLWFFIESEVRPSTAIELYQSLEFINRAILFFDYATSATVRGYEAARENKMKRTRG